MKLEKMKLVIVYLNLLGLLLIISCGTDNPVNNGNGNPPVSNDSLIFSIDSFTVYSYRPPHTSYEAFVDQSSQTRKYRVEIIGESNVPVTNDTAFIKYTCNPYPVGVEVMLESRNEELANFHINYTFIQDSTQNFTANYHGFSAGFSSHYPTSLLHYIKIKEFHLFLVR